MVKDIANNYIVGDHQLSNRLVQNNPREYRDSLLMLNKGKRDLPVALHSLKEDQERCYNEIFYGSARQIRPNANRYMDMLLFVHFFQGERIERSVEADPEINKATCHLFVTACKGCAYDERVIRYNIHIPD